MFLATVFIIVGCIILLNALGIIGGDFWAFFWAAFFIIVGFRMLAKSGKCPMCKMGFYQSKFHQKFHEGCCEDKNCCEHTHEENK